MTYHESPDQVSYSLETISADKYIGLTGNPLELHVIVRHYDSNYNRWDKTRRHGLPLTRYTDQPLASLRQERTAARAPRDDTIVSRTTSWGGLLPINQRCDERRGKIRWRPRHAMRSAGDRTTMEYTAAASSPATGVKRNYGYSGKTRVGKSKLCKSEGGGAKPSNHNLQREGQITSGENVAQLIRLGLIRHRETTPGRTQCSDPARVAAVAMYDDAGNR